MIAILPAIIPSIPSIKFIKFIIAVPNKDKNKREIINKIDESKFLIITRIFV